MPPNNTIGLAGRFANHVLRNLYASFLAEAGNISFVYSYDDEMKQLGIPLFRSGEKTYPETAIIRDEFFSDLLDKPVNYNIFVDWCSAQNHIFALRLYNYFRTTQVMKSIQEANKFKARYGANNDVYVHVRLDDAAEWNPGFDYYDAALTACVAQGVKGGYISSDSPNHPTVLVLAAKYNLQLFEGQEIETIMLASSCKNLVLSHGTFSWLMGSLGFFSSVYIPHPRFLKKWCGPIFDMPGWMVVNTEDK
jgi:hypothetical protein